MGWFAMAAGTATFLAALLFALIAQPDLNVTVIEKTAPLRHGGELPPNFIWKTIRVEI